MVPTQKQKFYKNLYINQISQTNFKSFSNQRSDIASMLSSLNSSLPFFSFAFLSFYMKHIFMLRNLFKSHLIRHSGTGGAFNNTQTALEHLRNSESTWALGLSEGTRTLGHLEGTQALRGHSGTQRALRHLENTRAPGRLRNLGTRTLRALGHLRYSGTWALRALRHSGTQGTRALGHSNHFI